MKPFRLLAVFAMIFLFGPYVLLNAGCAQQNVIRLSYPMAEGAIQATRNVVVCIVDFEFKRKDATIGERLNGEKLLPRTPVGRWLASSLAEEMQKAGYSVTLTENMETALAKKPDFIVTGEVEEVWLAEISVTRYTGSIRASITLSDGNGRDVTKNCYSSVYSKAVLPIYGVPQTLLNDALAEMLQPAARLLAHMMQ